MKFNKKIIYSFAAFLMTFGLVQPLQTAYGAEAGGAVQTNGVISFYKGDSPASSDSSTTEPSEVPKSGDTLPNTNNTVKPTGKYPSTGELVKTSLAFSGAAIVLFAIILILWRKRKVKGGAEE